MAKKTTFNNPDSQEREYTRLLLRYSKQLQADVNRVLLPRIDDVIVQFKVESRADSWIDTLDSLLAELARLALDAMGSVVTRLPGQFNAVSKFNEGQFKLVVKANTGLTVPPVMPGAPSSSLLGVNVFRSEPFLKPLAEGWISENTALIKSLPTRLHPELEGIVRRGVMNGQSVKDIKDQIKARYGVTDYRAKLIAQDQTLKLNADLTRYRLQSVGVERYIWRSVQDSRVRPEHADRNGNEYTWKEGAGGEHPGQPVRCRCRAEAIWDESDRSAPTDQPPETYNSLTDDDIAGIEESAAYKRQISALESEEVSAVRRYSESGYDYSYAHVNQYLRNGKVAPGHTVEKLESAVRNISSAIDKSSVGRNVLLYRGTFLSEYGISVAELKPGVILSDKAFVSTSLSKEVVLDSYARGKGVVLEIENKATSKALPMLSREVASITSEKEVLLPAGTRFEVIDVRTENGKTFVRVRRLDESRALRF